MHRSLSLRAVAATLALATCGGPSRHHLQAGPAPVSQPTGTATARTDSLRRPYTEADIRFMSDMIGHHDGKIKSVRSELDIAEKASGTARSSALEKLVGELEADARRAADAAKVRTLAGAVKQLAGTTT